MLCIGNKLEKFLTGGVQMCTKGCAECTGVMYEDISRGVYEDTGLGCARN